MEKVKNRMSLVEALAYRKKIKKVKHNIKLFDIVLYTDDNFIYVVDMIDGDCITLSDSYGSMFTVNVNKLIKLKHK